MIDRGLYNVAVNAYLEAKERITNLETITQALADELMVQDDILGFALLDCARALELLDAYEQEPRNPYEQWAKYSARVWAEWAEQYDDWLKTQEDARNAGNP